MIKIIKIVSKILKLLGKGEDKLLFFIEDEVLRKKVRNYINLAIVILSAALYVLKELV